MRVLVWHGKHDTAIYDATTKEALESSARLILETLVKDQWIYEPSLHVNWDEELVNMTPEQIKASPQAVQGLVEVAVRRKRASERNFKEELEEWTAIQAILRDEPATMTAWQVLSGRDGYEYEVYNLVNVITA